MWCTWSCSLQLDVAAMSHAMPLMPQMPLGGRDRADKTEASPSRSQSRMHHENADAAAAATVAVAVATTTAIE